MMVTEMTRMTPTIEDKLIRNDATIRSMHKARGPRWNVHPTLQPNGCDMHIESALPWTGHLGGSTIHV